MTQDTKTLEDVAFIGTAGYVFRLWHSWSDGNGILKDIYTLNDDGSISYTAANDESGTVTENVTPSSKVEELKASGDWHPELMLGLTEDQVNKAYSGLSDRIVKTRYVGL